jgi:hypothetical protein
VLAALKARARLAECRPSARHLAADGDGEMTGCPIVPAPKSASALGASTLRRL